MIKLTVLDDEKQHITINADEKMSIEASVVDGKLILTVYDEISLDEDDEPIGAYNGTNGKNFSWEKSYN